MNKLKNKLKSIRLIYDANAWMKSRSEKKVYLNTLKHYSNKPTADKAINILKKSAGARLVNLQKLNSKFHFFYLGTDELQDKSGILQAVEHWGKLSFFTKVDGSYGQHTAGTVPERKKINANRLLELFAQLKKEENVPHILIAQTFSSYIDADVFSELRNLYGTFIVNIGMDDRHQYWKGTFDLIPHIDLALTAAPECVDWYLKEGCPALFFAEASDLEIFHPMPALPKVHDVSFVGAKYGIREDIVLALRNAGVQVTTYGGGWGNGFLPVEEVPKLFAQSKVILGVGTIGYSKDFYALKMRDFDGPMAGSCYVTHDNKDLDLLFNVGKEIITYKSVQDCVEKIKYLIKNNEEREQIASAGFLRAKRDHTWIQRFNDFLNFILEK